MEQAEEVVGSSRQTVDINEGGVLSAPELLGEEDVVDHETAQSASMGAIDVFDCTGEYFVFYLGVERIHLTICLCSVLVGSVDATPVVTAVVVKDEPELVHDGDGVGGVVSNDQQFEECEEEQNNQFVIGKGVLWSTPRIVIVGLCPLFFRRR